MLSEWVVASYRNQAQKNGSSAPEAIS
jgi:hypothetical protein